MKKVVRNVGFRFIADEISPDTYVNVMDQYYPAWHAAEGTADPDLRPLGRRINGGEYQHAIRCAEESGLYRGFMRAR